jgi:hypothetical protein
VQEVERDRSGITHAEVGAHLLALWGLPHGVTEAVARHHDCPDPRAPFDAVAVTYVSNVLVEELEYELVPGALPASQLDYDYLEEIGVEPRLAHWRALATRYFEDSWS